MKLNGKTNSVAESLPPLEVRVSEKKSPLKDVKIDPNSQKFPDLNRSTTEEKMK